MRVILCQPTLDALAAHGIDAETGEVAAPTGTAIVFEMRQGNVIARNDDPRIPDMQGVPFVPPHDEAKKA